MIGQRPTCLIGDLSETIMLVGYQNARSETRHVIHIHYLGVMLVSNQASKVSDEACQYSMGLQWDMLSSDEAYQSPMRHVNLWWVSYLACWSPTRHVGLWLGMVVSDGFLIGLWIKIIFKWTQKRPKTEEIIMIMDNWLLSNFPPPPQFKKKRKNHNINTLKKKLIDNNALVV